MRTFNTNSPRHTKYFKGIFLCSSLILLVLFCFFPHYYIYKNSGDRICFRLGQVYSVYKNDYFTEIKKVDLTISYSGVEKDKLPVDIILDENVISLRHRGFVISATKYVVRNAPVLQVIAREILVDAMEDIANRVANWFSLIDHFSLMESSPIIR